MRDMTTAFSPAPATHHLTSRLYIPARIYEHPAAIQLELCSSPRDVRQILPLIYKHSLFHEHLFQTKLVSLFAGYGCLDEAIRVFESVDGAKPDVLYYTMLKGLSRYSSLESALWFFCRMRRDDVKPVVYNFIYLLKLCDNEAHLKRGKEIHGQIVVNGLCGNMFAMTAVVNMYGKCKQVDDACNLFEKMPERDLVCWNTIISGLVQNSFSEAAIALGPKMVKEGHRPDSVTVVSLLPAAADLESLSIGKAIHGYSVRCEFASMVNISSALVDMYSKCGDIDSARRVFERMNEKHVVAWNSIIDGYVEKGMPEEALLLFKKMMEDGFQPSNVTIMEALHACSESGNLEQGRSIHEMVDKLGLRSDVPITNSLITMYSKCKMIDVAAAIFEKLQGKTRVSWNAMILGYAQNGMPEEAMSAFREMYLRQIELDSFTMVSVVAAVAELSIPRHARWVHGVAVRKLLDRNVYVMTALVDMYAKCGSLHTARGLFDKMRERHVITWNAMIDGYGVHGRGGEALRLFEEMENGTVSPNEITYLCVLSACSHSGMVEDGLRVFQKMKENNIEPAMDHYGAMVDLQGRAGRLQEAWDFINGMSVRPGISVYGALLGACRIHNQVELGEEAARRIFELNPDEGGYHVLLANIYASSSRWEKVAKVRRVMETKKIRKTPGRSSVECGNVVHSFYSGDTTHPESKEIYAFLGELMDNLKRAGYVPDTNSIHDVEDAVKEQLLNAHSEKLAIAYALLNTAAGTPIHVRKNLRVCGDCHNATKYISLVTGREIVVRDMHRFHHFRNGGCSCGDYW